MADHIQRVAGMKDIEIERAASNLLTRFEPARLVHPGPTNVLRLFESIPKIVPGADYGVADLPFGELGRLTPDGCVELSEATYIGALTDDPRCRWTIAHELGHLMLHLKQIRRVLTERGRLHLARAADVAPYENPEIQAHKFAAGILCPLSAVTQLLKNVPRHKWALRVHETFLISKEAATKRVDYFARCHPRGTK